MRAALLMTLVLATAASAAVEKSDVTMTARPMLTQLQLNATAANGLRVDNTALHLIQLGTATPERATSSSTREVTFMVPMATRSWTVALVMTDKRHSKTWTAFFKGTWDGKKEACVVEKVESGPTIPDSGIAERAPVLPPLRDIPDAYKLPAASKSKRNGKWSNVGPTTGPALGDGMAQHHN